MTDRGISSTPPPTASTFGTRVRLAHAFDVRFPNASLALCCPLHGRLSPPWKIVERQLPMRHAQCSSQCSRLWNRNAGGRANPSTFDTYGSCKTEHTSPDPYGGARVLQTSTCGASLHQSCTRALRDTCRAEYTKARTNMPNISNPKPICHICRT